jgi:hypothetical protein
MSTNYYAHGPFPGGDTEEGLHIGQTAAGWRFLYRGWPEHGLTTAKSWYFFLLKNMSSIRDEYDRPYTLDEFRLIANRAEGGNGGQLKPRYGDRTNDQLDVGQHIDPDGNAFYSGEFC